MIQKFKNGSILYTGDDMLAQLSKAMNKRDNYTSKDCSFCKHEHDDNVCGDCSVNYDESGCSCHVNPPCSLCEDSLFEVSEYLINYKHYKQDGWRWECYKSKKNVFMKLTKLENLGLEIDAETLQTGEVSMTICNPKLDYIHEIQICEKAKFKAEMSKMIMKFKIE